MTTYGIEFLDVNGLARMCDTEGCPDRATSVWTATVIAGGATGSQRYACGRHNPMANMAMALPFNFASQPLCHACGQPVRFTVTWPCSA